MSNLPKKQLIQLNCSEVIGDKIQLTAGNTLIRANTGAGKTTFILKNLIKHNKIVLCCPTIAQVKQCEEDYGYRDDIHFIHGEKKISNTILKVMCQSNIVITYDQFARLQQYMDTKAVLVIDECQKLYSAGNYRDKAIYPIISAIKKSTFERTVLLTATRTEALFNQLHVHVSQYFDVQKEGGLDRNITIQYYPVSNQLNGLLDVCKRLAAVKKEKTEKVVMIRLNNITKSKSIQCYLQKQGYSVMLINREEMAHKKCTEMLSMSKLDLKYQVVICTSIMDEAINLNNANDEIDSIHIMGQHAHPEEITQFIGRMRIASPQIFIHLSNEIDKRKFKCQSVHKSYTDSMDQQFKQIEYYLEHQVLGVINQDKFRGFEDLVNTKMDKIKLLNALTGEALLCKGFMLDEEKIGLNYPSLGGLRYQKDLNKCYSNMHYLKFRLLQLIPHCSIKLRESKDVIDEQLLKDLSNCEEETKQNKAKVIPRVVKDVLDTLQSNSTKIIAHLQSQAKEGYNPYDKSNQPMHYEIYGEMVKLSDSLDNLKDIAHAIEKERVNTVVRLGFQYKTNPIVRILMKELSKLVANKSSAEKLYSYTEITALMNQWFSLCNQNRSMIALLKEFPLQDIKINEEQKLVLVEGGSIRLLKRFADVEVLNDKKVYSLKKIKFKNLCTYGYAFTDVPASSRKKTIIIDEVEYDAKTGRKVHKKRRLEEIDED